jgi:methylglutaconyl-CoA hydratase
VPGAGGTQRLPRAVGAALAKEMVFTGRALGAEEAARAGLVLRVVDEGGAYSAALELAAAVAASGPLAVRAAKAAVEEGADAPDMAAALARETRAYEKVLFSADRLEGLAAWREKRAPRWRGE